MKGQPSPWSRAVDQALADGDWHLLEDVVAAGAAAVPPGVAYRQGERRRRQVRASTPAQRQVGDTTTAVSAGARRQVRDLISCRIRRGTVERRGEQIRRRPMDMGDG